MPGNEHLVICGDLEPQKAGGRLLRLNLHGKAPNVRLQIADISRRLLTNLPDVLVDLLNLASYVYAADAAVSRGGRSAAQMGARWRRAFRFDVPVRLPDLWRSDAVRSALVETLGFLSDDEYQFEFHPFTHPPPADAYFPFPADEATRFSPDEVILFSGGLDSLAGAVNELSANKRVALVSHRSATKIAGAQLNLVQELKRRFGFDHVLHVPVWANLDGSLGQESTHRTRSFLFAALGAVTARLFDRDGIQFFENGIVSLNLPPVAQVVGARATRTTHPQTVAGFRRVLTEVLGRPFQVENPFAWLTKSEVIQSLAENGSGDLIRHARSCTCVHEMTRLHSHCGHCSQCIDRRFGVLAAGLGPEDPAEAYKIDLFSGERTAGPDREMALAYVRTASAIHSMADVAFFTHYGETNRVVGFFPESPDKVASSVLDLHRRHAAAVCRVVDGAIAANASALREARLPSTCLLALIVGQRPDEVAYPEGRVVEERTEPATVQIRMAFDEGGNRVLFHRWGELTGVSARLLLRETDCNDEETLRRRVLRCRNQISRIAKQAGDVPPPAYAVIENMPWHGYRLNPDGVRIVALAELCPSK
jgi:7-cyano-7-deazaguanine synthase in queuosine biosynthesis